MIDETTGTEVPANSASSASSERVGFCQDCGRPLSRETVRTVGSGVFCEPCLEVRLGSTAAAAGVPPPAPTAPPTGYAAPISSEPGEPSPFLAGLLGVIPGVGAMYNGQFAKGLVHFFIFAILVSMSDHVSGIFGFFAFAWVCYQVFEAYHTAVARRDGLPLPDPFGFNDIGERMGFGKNSGAAAHWKPRTPPPPPAGSNAAAWSSQSAVPPVPPAASAGTDWVGYVPPTAFGGGTVPPPYAPPSYADPAYSAASVKAAADTMAANIRAQVLRDAGVPASPYAETYTGTGAPGYSVNVPPVEILAGRRRFPVGAFWLIGLGLLILVANLMPDWRVSERWLPPVLLAGFAVWLFTRRLRSNARIVCIVRWPAVLMVLAIMLALHAAYFAITAGMTIAVLLIVFGGLLLVDRMTAPVPAFVEPVPAAGYYATETSASAATASSEATAYDDSTKGGQG